MIFFFLLLPGCGLLSNNTTVTSDFTPPTGQATDTTNKGPAGTRRLAIATSQDGQTFTPTGKVLTEQGNVPDIVINNEGMISVYYIGQGIETNKETTAVARSNDNGETWTYHLLDFVSFPSPRDPSDPDVVILPDGTYRMYYTDSVTRNEIGIRYAESPDGLTFTYQGIAFDDFSINDSTTYYFAGQWHMYIYDLAEPQQYYATSTDGKTFTGSKTPIYFLNDGNYYFGANPLVSDQAVRLFGFGRMNSVNDIRSFSSNDGSTWKEEAGSRLEKTSASMLGGSYLQDLTVGRLADGSYLMVYVTDYSK